MLRNHVQQMVTALHRPFGHLSLSDHQAQQPLARLTWLLKFVQNLKIWFEQVPFQRQAYSCLTMYIAVT